MAATTLGFTRLPRRPSNENCSRGRSIANFSGQLRLLPMPIYKRGGTAFVDDTVRDLFYALRTLKRAPLAAFTIVSTVALGLGLVTVAFTLLNALLFRV